MEFSLDPELLGLLDNVALVTAGGAGIGQATAIQLARAGCHVAVVDIDGAAARSTAERIEGLGRRSVAIEADACDAAAVKDFVAQARRALGPLDVAANVVGGTLFMKPFLDLTREDWNRVIERNVFTAAFGCQAEGIAMIEDGRKGRIVNVASSSGIVGSPNIVPYGVAKAGLIHMTKSVAMELAPYGLRVNCVVPGTHETVRTRQMATGPDAGVREFYAAAAKAPPLGRLGDPMETAGVAVFLASSLSSYVTGHIVVSDGGVTHTTHRPPVGGGLELPQALAHIPGLREPASSDSQ